MIVTAPVEVKVRDFKPAVWLTLNLIDNGHKVFLGENTSMRDGYDLLEPDIYFRNGISESKLKVEICRNIQQGGGSVVALDTEGAVVADDSVFRDLYSDAEILEYFDEFFLWGEKQYSLFTESTNFDQKHAHITGHFRFDLLHDDLREIYRGQTNTYTEEHGEYILILTNFIRANHATKPPEAFAEDIVSFENELLQAYVQLSKQLSAEFQSHTIIIRPHPLEDLDYYRQQTAEEDAVQTIHEGDVRPWILGADAVVHKSSTSGVESALLNTPVISYRPVIKADEDRDLPILVSDEQRDEEGVLRVIAEYIADGGVYELNETQSEGLNQYLDNSDGNYATEKIVKVMESIDTQGDVNLDHVSVPLDQKLKRFSNRAFGKEVTETAAETLGVSDFSGARQKVNHINEDEISSEIDKFERHTGIKSEDVVIEPVEPLPNVYFLHRRNS